ncbi:MAG: DUF934 domain-containing protein [Gallionella sp.]|jgi:uncharacterized protein (DUF934 family)
MFKIIKNERITTESWKTITLKGRETPQNVRLPVGPLLVPLSVWQARRAELIHREYEHGWALGVWLANAQEAYAIESDIDDFTVVALEFNRPAGSYSSARLLREHFGFKGELRINDDQTDSLQQTGFDLHDQTTAHWFDFKQPDGPRLAAG